MNGFLSQLGGLPQLLWSNLAGTVSVRARKIIVSTNLTLTDNADGSATLTASGGGGGDVATDAIWDAKGDLAVGTGADTAAKLAVGSDGDVLTADSTQTTGTKWAAGGGASSVLLQQTIHNDSGSTFAIGTILLDAEYVIGGVLVAYPTRRLNTSDHFVGVATESIADGATGVVTRFGVVTGIDTSGFFVSDLLYSDAVGALTTVPGMFLVAYVLTSAVSGSIFVLPEQETPNPHGHTRSGLNDGGLLTVPIFQESVHGVVDPPSGYQELRVDDVTHHLTARDSAGVDRDIEAAAAGNVAADVLWDAKGDLVVGTGANTAAKLTVGANDTIPMADTAATTGIKWVASQTPSTQAFGDSATEGTADTYARGDHKHTMPASPFASPTFTGITTAPEFSASGLTGAVSASRYVGATASGAPVSGTFVLGDWIAAQDGKRWTCTVGGTPGTWVQEPGTGGGGNVATDAIWDAKGDLAAGTGADTAAKLTVGADDTILMADAAASTGLKWVASQTPSTQAFGDAAAQGTADTYARGDHKHAMPAAPTTVATDVIFDAKGDLAVGTGADTSAKLTVGTNAFVLTADSTQTTGLKWAAASGSGALTLISTQTVSGSSVASITFSSIAGTYTHLWLLFQALATGANNFQRFLFQFNGDTNTNYIYVDDDSAGTAAQTGQSSIGMGYIAGGNASANYATSGQVLIPNYAATTFNKTAVVLSGMQSGLNRTERNSGTWNNTAAITQILIKLDANNIAIGSSISLYGVSG